MRFNSPAPIFLLCKKQIQKFVSKDNAQLLLIIENWHYIVGNELSQYTIPKKLTKNILYIETISPIFSSQIYYLQKEILDKIKLFIANKEIKTIKITINAKSYSLEENPSIEPQATCQNNQKFEAGCFDGVDEELKKSLLKFAKNIR